MDWNPTLPWILIFLIKGCVWASQLPFFGSLIGGPIKTHQMYCSNNQGRLVSIDTQAKYDRMVDFAKKYNKNYLSTTASLFIGLSTQQNDCTGYTWSSGRPLTWSKWDDGENEPNGCDLERCVALVTGHFRTVSCNKEFFGICETGYFFPNSNLYISPETISYVDAFRYCATIGGRSIVFTDEDTMTSTALELKGAPVNWDIGNNFWIGLFSITLTCDKFTWVSGATMQWTKIAMSEADCSKGRCVVWSLAEQIWQIAKCNHEIGRAVCEYGNEENTRFYCSDTKVGWREADRECSVTGGKLATLETTSLFINANLMEYVCMSAKPWFGLYTNASTCSNYKWINGKPFTWYIWNKGEPNYCGTNYCFSVFNLGFSTDLCETNKRVLCMTETQAPVTTTTTRQRTSTMADVTSTSRTSTEITTISTGMSSLSSPPSTTETSVMLTRPRSSAPLSHTTSVMPTTENDMPSTSSSYSTAEAISTKTTTNAETQAPVTTTTTRKRTSTMADVTSTSRTSTEITKISTGMSSLSSPPSTTETYVMLTRPRSSAPLSHTTSVMPTTENDMPLISSSYSTAEAISTKTTTNAGTSTTSTTQYPTSHTDVTTTNTLCRVMKVNVTQMSQSELLEAIAQLKEELTVSKKNTSTYRRKQISVFESRPSSMIMGGVACSFMSIVIGWMVVPDFISIWVFLYKYIRNKSVVIQV